MEVIDLHQKAEELLSQLNQLRDFSEKYADMGLQTGNAIRKTGDVLMIVERTMEGTGILIDKVNATFTAQKAEMELLRELTAKTVREKCEELQESANNLLDSLQAGFLIQQGEHINQIQTNLGKVSEIAGEIQSNLRQDLQAVREELSHLVDKRVSQLSNMFAEKSDLLGKSVEKAIDLFSKRLDEADTRYLENMQTLKRQNGMNTVIQIVTIIFVILIGLLLIRK
jgi:hypothetical protein